MKKLKRCACGLFILIFALVLAFGSGCSSVFATFGILVGTAIDGLTQAPTTIEDVAKSLSRWGITLPDDSELIYHKYWQGFPGENATYNIIGFETQPSQLIADFSDNPDQPCDGQRSFEENVSACFNSFIVEVPEAEEFIPDLTCDYVWKYLEKENSQSEMFFLYYPNDVVLYTFKYVM